MSGKINDDSGLIDNNTGMVNQDAGMINENTGMIEDFTGMVNGSTGMINDTNGTKYTVNGRRKRSRERGKDSKPRNFPLHTMKNLPQFRNKSHQEVRQYILEKKGVDIGSNFNFGGLMLWVFVILVITAGGISIAKWLRKRQERKNNETYVETD